MRQPARCLVDKVHGCGRAQLDRSLRGASIGRTWTRGGGAALLFLLVVYVALQPSAAHAEFTTKSPKVRELVAKGVKILESEQDRRVGAEALVGLTLLKADVRPKIPSSKRRWRPSARRKPVKESSTSTTCTPSGCA